MNRSNHAADPRLLPYTMVALFGILAGVLIGLVYAQRPENQPASTVPIPHPRSLAPKGG